MKVLVSGGAGYIGSHVVDTLVTQGHEVVVYDNLKAGHRQAVNPGALLIEGDLLNPAQLAPVFDAHKFDGVMHFASHIQVGESMQRPWKYLRDNVVAASNLLEQVTRVGVGRFILSSTANLYDQPVRIPISEDEPVIPGSPYGESKAMIERQLYWMGRIYGLRYCALRYFNACGASADGHIGEDHDPETHLIPVILQVALGQREQVTIFGNDYPTNDGTCVRDYIHVLDLADAHIRALEALADGRSRLYNLGSGSGYSNLEVVETARAVTGHPIPITLGPRRAGDLPVLVADSSKAKSELGWVPKYDNLRRIIETAWGWHSTHPQGYATK